MMGKEGTGSRITPSFDLSNWMENGIIYREEKEFLAGWRGKVCRVFEKQSSHSQGSIITNGKNYTDPL